VKKITASILTVMLTLSMVFSSSVFAAEKTSAWDSFVGLFSNDTATTEAASVGVQYKGHVQNKGDVDWVTGPETLGTEGESLRLEAFYIELTDAPADMHIMYRVQVQNKGWMDWAEDGAIAGTTGEGLQVETVEIKLVDDNGDAYPGYSVEYQGHVQNKGDMPADESWYVDGEQLGTVGEFLRLEALRVQIVKDAADMTAYNAAVEAAEALTEADYTADSWAALQTALTDNVVTEDNTQEEVDAATEAITAATDSLVKILKVESVTAINASQVQVTFSKAIDSTTVISNTTTGALVNGGTGIVTIARSTASTTANKNVATFATGFLSADGTVLTLTATSPTYFDGTYALTMSDKVETVADEKLVAYAGTFTYTDTVAPTVTDMTYNTITGNIDVTVSEPITAVPTIARVNGSPVTGSAFVANSNQTKFSVPKPASVLAGSTATVYVAGATDFTTTNQLVGYTGSVLITSDATALAVESMTQNSSNQIKVVFNKSIASTDTVVDGATTVLMDGTAMSAADVTVAKDTTDTLNKTYLITFGNTYVAKDYFYGSASTKNLVVTFTNNVIADVFGQKLATSTTTVAMTKDLTGPVAQSVKLSSDGTKFEVTFDENIASLGTTTNIVLRKDGVAMSSTATAARKAATGDDAKVLVIGPNAADLVSGVIPAGTYQIRLNDSAIADLHTNNNAAQTLTLTVTGDATKLTAAITNNGADNKFKVTYSDVVTSASALNLANYTLDGAALPASTDIYFTDSTAKIVAIDLPTESVNIGVTGTPAYASLAVKNVQTAAGLVVTPISGSVTVMDNTKPVLQSATIIDNKTIELTYSEAMAAVSAASVGDEFTINQNGTDMTLAATELTATNVSGYTNKVRVTVAQGSDSAGTAEVNTLTVGSAPVTTSGDITVAFSDGTITDSRTVAVVNPTDAAASDVAAKIVASYTASPLAGYTVTQSGADVIFTATAAAADKTVTATITDTDTTGVGSATSSQTTAGIAPTSATVLNLYATTTVTTITPTTANMKDLAANDQKVGTVVTAN
jgi:uncharacterized protein YjdB